MIKLLPPLFTLLLLVSGFENALLANNPNPNPNYCQNVTVTGGSEITITGVNAPWHRIEFKRSGADDYIELCNDNCLNPDNISGLADGFYIVKVDQSDHGGANYCRETYTVLVHNPPVIDHCADVVVQGGEGEITITGVDASWNRIQYRLEGSDVYSVICDDNCSNPQKVSGLAAGIYIIKAEQSSGGDDDYCSVEIAAEVTSAAIDYSADVVVMGGEGEIMIMGVDAPRHRIQYRLDGSDVYYDVCTDNCNNPHIITGLAAGLYIVRTEQSSSDGSNFSFREIAAEVTSAAIDYCADVVVMGGEGEIMIMGVDAPWHRIQYRLDGSDVYSDICNDFCNNPHIVTGLSAGLYIIKVEQSSGSDNYCSLEIAAEVTSAAIDYCADVVVMGGEGEIMIMGVDAPWHRIQYRLDGSDVYSDICNDFCNNPHIVTGLAAGLYIIKVEQSSGSDNYCSLEIAAEVTSAAVDYSADVVVMGGEGEIMIMGVDAPRHRIQYRLEGSDVYYDVCTDNCNNPHLITGLAAGLYIVRAEQSNSDGSNFSFVEIAAEVTDSGLCAGVGVSGGNGSITISGIVGSWNHVQILGPNSQSFMSACDDNCSNPQVISGLVAGEYYLLIEQSNGNSSDYCKIETRVVVSSHLGTDASESRIAEYTTFNAYTYQRTVNLEWATNTTFKSEYYVVEKSADGTTFEPIEKVANIFDGNNLAYFESRDEAPILGTNFYRLKQVFQDGTSEYSEVRAIQFGVNLAAIEAFPNPAQNKLYINLSEYAGKKANIIITNQFGQVVTEQQFEALPSDLLQIDVANYTNGLYLIRTKIDRTKLRTEKFMVSKMY